MRDVVQPAIRGGTKYLVRRRDLKRVRRSDQYGLFARMRCNLSWARSLAATCTRCCALRTWHHSQYCRQLRVR